VSIKPFPIGPQTGGEIVGYQASEPATDRELLEAAARAAGIEHGTDRLDCGLSLTGKDGRHTSLPQWNPLTDDGDALRLAVKLFLWEAVRDGYQHVDSDNDFCAATRRAIVRAAAALAPTNRPVSPDTSV
jgi:hypothetical protein